MWSLIVRCFAVVIAAASALACASTAGSSEQASGALAPRHDRTQIVAAEMSGLDVSNLFEVVQRLHPEWLVLRNQGSVSASAGRSNPMDTGVQVYLDTQHAGNTDILKQMTVSSAASLKYYSASEAQARFGNGNMSGAIQVVTVRLP